ncbi:hypothetical protein SCA6_006732 [Theobroma cacao]
MPPLKGHCLEEPNCMQLLMPATAELFLICLMLQDEQAFTGTNTRTGAMTFSFIQAVQHEPRLTYGRLLNAMRNAIRDVKAGLRLNGPIATLINKVLFGTTTQIFFFT